MGKLRDYSKSDKPGMIDALAKHPQWTRLISHGQCGRCGKRPRQRTSNDACKPTLRLPIPRNRLPKKSESSGYRRNNLGFLHHTLISPVNVRASCSCLSTGAIASVHRETFAITHTYPSTPHRQLTCAINTAQAW